MKKQSVPNVKKVHKQMKSPEHLMFHIKAFAQNAGLTTRPR